MSTTYFCRQAMPPTASTSKGSTTRNAILAEARRVLVERGYQGLVMREVAESCGIKLGNLQYYFPTAEALILTVIDQEAQQDVETIRRALEQTQDPIEALRVIVEELVTRWRSDAAPIYATLNLLALHNDAYRTLYARIYANHYAALEQAIGAAVPRLSRAECAQRARLMTALIDGSSYQTRVGRKSKFLSLVVEKACDLALAATEQT